MNAIMGGFGSHKEENGMRQLQRVTAIVAGLAVLIGMAGGASGQTLEPVGEWPGSANAITFGTTGAGQKLVFLGIGNGVMVFDVTNDPEPTKNKIIAQIYTPGIVQGFFYKEPNLYLADGYAGGLQIFDVSTPSSPVKKEPIQTPGAAMDVFVFENKAYIADGFAGLQIIDLQQPASPVWYTEATDARGVFVENRVMAGQTSQTWVYIADGVNGLLTVNASNGQTYGPLSVGGGVASDVVVDVDANDKMAYIEAGDAGVFFIDVNDPQDPNITKDPSESNSELSSTLNKRVSSLEMLDIPTVYAGTEAGLMILNVSTLNGPNVYGPEGTGPITDVVYNQGYVYVANGESGMTVFKDSNVPNYVEDRGSIKIPGHVVDIMVTDNTAYLADRDNSLHILEISNQPEPIVTGTKRLDLEDEARAISVTDAYIFVLEGPNILRMINISQPGNSPTFLTSLTDGKDVFATDGYAYVADGSEGLKIFDVSNINAVDPPFVDTPGTAVQVAVSGEYAYVADVEGGLRIINISDPSNPQEEEPYNETLMSANSVVVYENNYAYVADGQEGVAIINLNLDNPNDDPFEENEKPLRDIGTVTAMVISGNFLHIALANDTIQTYYLIKPTAPVKINNYDTGAPVDALTFSGNDIYVAKGSSGMEALRFTPPESPDAPIVPAETEIEKAARWFVAEWEAVSQADGYELDVAHDQAFDHYVPGYERKPVSANTATVVGLEPDAVYFYRVRAINNGIAGADSNTVSVRTQAEFAQIGAWTNAAFDAIALNPYESILFMGSGAEIYVFDVSDPADPSKIGQLSTPGSVRDLFYEDDYLYVADDWKGLRIYDLDEPWSPEIGFFPEYGDQREVEAVFPSYIGIDAAFIVGGVDEGVAVLDTRDKTSPQFLFDYPLVYASDVVFDPWSELTFVTDSFGLRIFGMFNDSYFGLVGAVEIPGAALSVDLSDDFAYVAGSDGVYAIDFKNPSDARIVDYYETPRKVEAVHVTPAGYVYFLDGDTIYLWKNADDYVMTYADSASKPEKDIVQNGLSGSAHNFSVWGPYVFVADGDKGLKVFQYAYELSPPEINPDPYYVSDDVISVEWRPVPGATEYLVEISEDHFQTVLFTDNRIGTWYWSNEKLKPSTEYHVRVTTKMADVESDPVEWEPIQTKPSREPGDLDNDGLVTLSDAIIALKIIVGITPDVFHPEYVDSTVDIDGNDQAGLAEALFSLQVAAGLR